MWLIVGKRLAGKISRNSLPTRRGINGLQQLRKWLSRCVTAQGQYLVPLQQQINRSSQARPEFHLSGNRTLDHFAREPGIQNESVRKLDWLAHGFMVA